MIKEKIYYYITFKLETPLSIGNGDDILTKHDLIKDSQGNTFIPATSLMGSILSCLTEDKELINPLDKQSRFFISDAKITNTKTITTSIRDNVSLDENKTSKDGEKFDIEILESGACFAFRIEITVRENEDSKKLQEIVKKILANLNAGNILLGTKSKRGFGRVTITSAKEITFTKNNIDEMLNFDKYNKDSYKNDVNYQDSKYIEDKYDTLEVNLQQEGGISIRSYIAKTGEVDYEHIKSNGKPIIPATSFNGLIRKQLNYYEKLLDIDVHLNDWFGSVDKITKKATASKIIIEESTIEDSTELLVNRNSINRFSGGTVNSALFFEKSNYNGHTTLVIKIPKQITINNTIIKNNYLLGLLALVLKDINNGLLAIGGQTAIGRGILRITETKLNDTKQELDNLIKPLAQIIKRGDSNE